MTDEFLNNPVITIDGPSGTGKGTLAQSLARELNWHYLDSGAVYRVLAYASNQAGVEANDIDGLLELITEIHMDFVTRDDRYRVELDGVDVTRALRDEAVGSKASQLSVHPRVREALLDLQRGFALSPGLVTDGRDMGTVVFPQAIVKIYLEASPKIRAQRRYKQLKETGKDVNLDKIYESMVVRDQRDRERAASPTRPALGAHIIDTSEQSRDQVFIEVSNLAKNALMGV